MKNNLQIIDSLLAAQAKQLPDTESATALHNLRQRVYALGLVHQQLMGSKDLQTFDIAPFLQELSTNIVGASAFQEVKLSVQAISLPVDLDFAIPLGLLVTELLTNSLRHAFPTGSGNIAVVLHRTEVQKLALVVSDDGQGHQTRAEAAAPAKKAGLGMKIIAGLVAQLRGTDPSRLRQFQTLGSRHLSRRPQAASTPLPRRIRLPLEPPTPHEIVVCCST